MPRSLQCLNSTTVSRQRHLRRYAACTMSSWVYITSEANRKWKSCGTLDPTQAQHSCDTDQHAAPRTQLHGCDHVSSQFLAIRALRRLYCGAALNWNIYRSHIFVHRRRWNLWPTHRSPSRLVGQRSKHCILAWIMVCAYFIHLCPLLPRSYGSDCQGVRQTLPPPLW